MKKDIADNDNLDCEQENDAVLRPGTKIVVTSDDIMNGEGGSPTCCAVALAVRRLIQDDCYPYVTSDWMEIVSRNGKTRQRIDIPYEVGEWVMAFDEQCAFEECNTAEELADFWEEYNDGEPYEVRRVEPFEFVVPE